MVQTDASGPSRAEILDQAVGRWRPQLTGKVAVVTGGARGIGRAMTEGLIRAGAKVAALDKTWGNDEEFRKQLEASGNGIGVEADVTNDAQLDAAYKAVIDRFGTTDILINNAALVSETLFAPKGRVKTLDTSDRDWETMFGVNVFGLLKGIRRFIKPMQEKGSGSIVSVISSGALTVSAGTGYFALRPNSLEMPYQATKAAVMTMSFYLGAEVRDEGIAVNQVMPGHTRASWFDTTARAWADIGQTYGGRPVVPEHIVPITLFLASQDAKGVTGMLYGVSDWNFDNGYGKTSVWLDRDMPADLDERYKEIEAAQAQRAGMPVMGVSTPTMRP